MTRVLAHAHSSETVVRRTPHPVTQVIGSIPYRLALAGGWIDQPFVSQLNPNPPGSMVVVGIEPNFRAMDRSGLANGTRWVAMRLWDGALPARSPEALVRELYEAENAGKAEPSGSQDMIGLIYPGVNRLDYHCAVHGGVFPARIESIGDEAVLAWLERVIHVIAVAPRPMGYNPLGEKRLDPAWVERLGQSGKDCFEAVRQQNTSALGASMNACMECWQALLPHTVEHFTITQDLVGLLRCYQAQYAGAMYSGCGGGYLLVISEEWVPGAFHVTIRRPETT